MLATDRVPEGIGDSIQRNDRGDYVACADVTASEQLDGFGVVVTAGVYPASSTTRGAVLDPEVLAIGFRDV